MNAIRILMFIPLVCVFGCATITRGTTEAFVIETEPPGADAWFSSGETCRTPCTLTKKRKDAFNVKIELGGFEPTEVNVVSEIARGGAAGMAGNVLFGGIIGAGIDAGSGAMKQLTPNPVVVKLIPSNSGMENSASDDLISAMLDADQVVGSETEIPDPDLGPEVSDADESGDSVNDAATGSEANQMVNVVPD